MDVATLYIEPGSPWETDHAESFHSRVRDEFLAIEEFESLSAAKRLTWQWRDDYNQHRPHSSLGDIAPAEFAAGCAAAASETCHYPSPNQYPGTDNGGTSMSFARVSYAWPAPIATWLVAIICLGPQIGGTTLAAAPPPQRTMVYEVDPTDLPKDTLGVMDQLVEAVSRRLNSDRTPLAVVHRLDDRRLQVALMESNKLSRTRVKGLLAMTGTLEFRILADEHDDDAVREIIAQATTHPTERRVLNSQKRPIAWWVPIKVGREAMFAGNAYAGVSRRVLGQGYRQRTELLVLNDAYHITDKHISQARPSTYRNRPCVNITFNTRGRQLFGLLTSTHLPEAATGFMYKLGVILDGQLYSAPAIQSTMSDNVELNGSFGQQETEDIARVLHYGCLPARIRLVNEGN